MDEEHEDLDRPIPRPAADFVPLLESNDPVTQRLLEKAKRAAASEATILLTGESGTGKDVLAHQIHRWSPRAECPFVTVNCTGLSEHLLESELFGHMRGAFDGAIKDQPGRLEAAHGGSILLDEISDLSVPLQTKLLHFIKEQSFERMGSENTITSRRSNHRGVEPRPGLGSCSTAIPRGPVLSTGCDHFAGSGLARASRRHFASGDANARRRDHP